jgi:hypothetical protein
VPDKQAAANVVRSEYGQHLNNNVAFFKLRIILTSNLIHTFGAVANYVPAPNRSLSSAVVWPDWVRRIRSP